MLKNFNKTGVSPQSSNPKMSSAAIGDLAKIKIIKINNTMPFSTKFTVNATRHCKTFVRNLSRQIESYSLKSKHVNFALNDIGVFSVCKVKYLTQTISLDMAQCLSAFEAFLWRYVPKPSLIGQATHEITLMII
jgi:hypothetical protein